MGWRRHSIAATYFALGNFSPLFVSLGIGIGIIWRACSSSLRIRDMAFLCGTMTFVLSFSEVEIVSSCLNMIAVPLK